MLEWMTREERKHLRRLAKRIGEYASGELNFMTPDWWRNEGMKDIAAGMPTYAAECFMFADEIECGKLGETI